MEWKKSFLDLILVPLGILITILYQVFLWYRVRNYTLRTVIGVNSIGRKLWVKSMMKDSDKNGVVAVQTLRNSIMGSTLMATTSILLGCGLAAMISSTYSIKKPLNDTTFGSQEGITLSIKYLLMLMFMVLSFLCHSLSICCKCEVSSLIATPMKRHELASLDGTDYICELLERGFLFSIVGNRAFYGAFPLILWVVGPLPFFLGSAVLIPILYNADFSSTSIIADRNSETEMRRADSLE